jgi:hypothetical protein
VDKDIQEYYEARFDMMASKGWKDLMEDTQKMLDAYNKIERLAGVEDLYYAKGQLDILNWVINLKQTSEEAYRELTDETDI